LVDGLRDEPERSAQSSDVTSRNGGAEGNRTPDLVIANDALSQLSYGPVSGPPESAGDLGARVLFRPGPAVKDRARAP
jgi:hypothetical protein